MRTITRYAPNGMVCSIDQLASEAGVALLRAGGSAADAAIAASAVLAVTSPHACGMGGDLFALVHPRDAVAPTALNASGRAGSGADPDRMRAEGFTTMPFRLDLRSAPVPGCVDGWIALHEQYGRLPLADVLRPAVSYARDGFPASPLLAGALLSLRGLPNIEDLVGPNGSRRSGERITRPGVATALEAIVERGRDGFYRGAFGQGLLELGAGEYTVADFERVNADWVEPLAVEVYDHVLWTTPPNSQGYLTLLGAAIAAELPLPENPDDPQWAHLLIEAARVAAHDRPAVLHEHADVRPLLSPPSISARRAMVDPEQRAELPTPTAVGDTIFLCAVDSERMGVSLIQSNAKGFGTGVFEPATGIGLHDRGIGFTLEPGHPAEYGPGRRPPHTLSPALITDGTGALRATIGTMGGDSQPQLMLQLVTRLLRHGQSAGATISAPRWTLVNANQGEEESGFGTWADPNGVHVDVEDDAPVDWPEGLRSRGHAVNVVSGLGAAFGHAHLIELTSDGMLAGAADPRALIALAAGY